MPILNCKSTKLATDANCFILPTLNLKLWKNQRTIKRWRFGYCNAFLAFFLPGIKTA